MRFSKEEIKAHNDARDAVLKKALKDGEELTADELELINSSEWTTLSVEKRSDPSLIKKLKTFGVKLSTDVVFPVALPTLFARYLLKDLYTVGNHARSSWHWLSHQDPVLDLLP